MQGASVNAQNDLGWTPLHTAAYNGRQAAAEALLKVYI
jgi:ankyrin repeat protein